MANGNITTGAMIGVGSILVFVFFMMLLGMFLAPCGTTTSYYGEKKRDSVLQTGFLNVGRL